jgi:putative spermidine/putrescine transport system substrate-binding protein
VLESALMADGVAMESLYPLDIDRALKKIKELKDHLVFWGGGAESQQMLVQGDVVMAQVWHNRATVLERQTSGRITWTWNQATIGPGGWAIPKGNPAGAAWANRWIAYMQDPKEQLGVLDCMGFAPANAAAWDLETEAQRRLDPTRPENAKLQVPIDEAFYADHYDEMLNRFTDLISS